MSAVTDLRTKEAPSIAEPKAEKAFSAPLPFWQRRRFRMSAIGVIALLFLAVAADWLVHRWTHVYIDDSRIAANLITVSSEVNGRVLEVPVVIGDAVKKGDLLVRIDRSQTKLERDAIEAQIAAIEAEKQQLRAQQDMIRVQIAKKIDAAKAEVAAAEAAYRASRAVLQKAHSHYDRIEALAQRKVVAQENLEEALAERTTAEQQQNATEARIATAKANLAVVEAQAAEIEVLERQIAVLESRKSAQIAERDRKDVEIDRGTIRAAFDGVVGATFVDPGEYVSPGARLLVYHDPSNVWVDANVKETDFSRLKLGAPATITVDAYSDLEFKGKVIRLGEAATSQFALLPSPNPSGNFTKITQRVPIRVSVEQKDGLLRPGMMVEVSIDVVD